MSCLSIPSFLLGRVLAVMSFHPGHTKMVIRIPNALPCLLGNLVLSVRFPSNNRFLARPIRNRNAETIRGACALHAEKARLLRSR